MKKPIPNCEHGNEYEFDSIYGLTLHNEKNTIHLSRFDFRQLDKIWEKEELKHELEIKSR